MRKPTTIQECRICGVTFTPAIKYSGSRRRIYCGPKCCDIARQCRETGRAPSEYFKQKVCPECGNPVVGKFTKVFCSRKCAAISYNRTETVKLCSICDAEFKPSGFEHTCSDACQKKLDMLRLLRTHFRRGRNGIVKCPRCQCLFLKKGRIQKLCKPCGMEVLKLRRYQIDLKRLRNALPPSDKCRQCGSNLDRNGKFCSLCLTERQMYTWRKFATKRRTARLKYEQSISAVRNFYVFSELTKQLSKESNAATN